MAAAEERGIKENENQLRRPPSSRFSDDKAKISFRSSSLSLSLFSLCGGPPRNGEVTLEKELSYNYSYFQVRNLGTLVTSVTVTTIKS